MRRSPCQSQDAFCVSRHVFFYDSIIYSENRANRTHVRVRVCFYIYSRVCCCIPQLCSTSAPRRRRGIVLRGVESVPPATNEQNFNSKFCFLLSSTDENEGSNLRAASPSRFLLLFSCVCVSFSGKRKSPADPPRTRFPFFCCLFQAREMKKRGLISTPRRRLAFCIVFVCCVRVSFCGNRKRGV